MCLVLIATSWFACILCGNWQNFFICIYPYDRYFLFKNDHTVFRETYGRVCLLFHLLCT